MPIYNLKRLTKKYTTVFTVAMSFACVTHASNDVIEHRSHQYIENQYNILKHSFSDFTVEKVNNGLSIKIVIPNNYGFKTASIELKPETKQTLRTMGNMFRTYPETLIDIVGHTDNVGNAEYNLELGALRASAVQHELIRASVSPLRISTSSKGMTQPACDNSTESGRECNRRVELFLHLERNLEF